MTLLLNILELSKSSNGFWSIISGRFLEEAYSSNRPMASLAREREKDLFGSESGWGGSFVQCTVNESV